MKKKAIFILFIFALAGCASDIEYGPVKHEKKYEYDEKKREYTLIEKDTVEVKWKN